MKLVGVYLSNDRFGDMFVTDLSLMEFSTHIRHAYGSHAIMHVSDVSPQESQRWEALGYNCVFRKNINR